jgi:hypothetical protein
MSKKIKITEDQLKRLMVLKEENQGLGDFGSESPKDDLAQKAQDAVQQLSPEEQEVLSNFIQNNPQGFVHTVKKELSQEKQEEMSEEDEMGDNEFEARRILHKVIQYVGVGSMLAVVPAAMFISGGVAAALGVTALAGTMFKDAAFFKRGGKYRDHHYDAQDRAERMNDNGNSSNDMNEESDGEMNDSNDELDRMADSFIRQYKEKAIQGVDEDMVNSLCDKIRQGLGGEESQSKYEMPGYQETMDNLNNLSIREDDDMVNESVQKIKSTFKRFL